MLLLVSLHVSVLFTRMHDRSAKTRCVVRVCNLQRNQRDPCCCWCRFTYLSCLQECTTARCVAGVLPSSREPLTPSRVEMPSSEPNRNNNCFSRDPPAHHSETVYQPRLWQLWSSQPPAGAAP